MTELSTQARRLIALARDEDEAQPGTLSRVELSLAARIAAGVGLGAASATVAKSAAGAAFGVMAAKVGVVGTMIAATAGAGWMISRASSFTESEAGVGTASALRSPSGPRASTVSGAQASTEGSNQAPTRDLPATVEADTSPQTASAGQSTGKLRKPPTRSEASPAAAEAPTDPLQAETLGLREVQRALSSKQAAQALALLDRQEARYPGGALAQERAAARVFALCLGGQTDQARSRAEQFERNWPRSPLVARIQSSCKAQGKDR